MTREAYDFDVIVVGSGISGGWAAKELCERGFKVGLVERGRMVEHQTDYTTEMLAPWELQHRGFGDQKRYDRDYTHQQGRYFNEWTERFWVNDRENPYETPEGQPFQWRRGYQLGGRSLTWGRHVFRRSDHDFEANRKDGHGVDWPIRYKDIARWYDHVEDFIGVSGNRDGVEGLPDGVFQAPFPLNVVEQALKEKVEAHYDKRRRLIIGRVAHLREEKEGRAPCQSRVICARGCSYGAYFSTQSSTLPAAQKTGNLTLLTDMVVHSVEYDPQTRRARGVILQGVKDVSQRRLTARAIFLCASSFNSVGILLRSKSEDFPRGLGNSSGLLGCYIMDHAGVSLAARIRGFEDHTYAINRPASFIIPRFANISEPLDDALRGYSYQGGAVRAGYTRGTASPGIGRDFKESLKSPGDWILGMGAFIEALPQKNNRVSLAETAVDAFGMPQIRIDYRISDNERKLAGHAVREAAAMAGLLDGEVLSASLQPGTPGNSVHEMGGACMGNDPQNSVLDAFNRCHDAPNVFVTDGAAMSSSGTVNPSLTYMALTARAAAQAAELMKLGQI